MLLLLIVKDSAVTEHVSGSGIGLSASQALFYLNLGKKLSAIIITILFF